MSTCELNLIRPHPAPHTHVSFDNYSPNVLPKGGFTRNVVWFESQTLTICRRKFPCGLARIDSLHRVRPAMLKRRPSSSNFRRSVAVFNFANWYIIQGKQELSLNHIQTLLYTSRGTRHALSWVCRRSRRSSYYFATCWRVSRATRTYHRVHTISLPVLRLATVWSNELIKTASVKVDVFGAISIWLTLNLPFIDN